MTDATAHDARVAEILSRFDETSGRLLARLGMFEVASKAPDKATFLQRPDLGRTLSDEGRAELTKRIGRAPTLAIIYGDGQQALDYVYVDDVVGALLMLAEPDHDGLVCNVGTGRAVSVSELTEIMLTISGRTLEPVMCPPDWTAGSVRVADTRLARETLGWTATTRIEEGLERVWDSLGDTDG